MSGSASDPVRLDQFQNIIEVGWGDGFTHIAFEIVLNSGFVSGIQNITGADCSGGIAGTGAASNVFCAAYTYPYALLEVSIHGLHDGEWISASDTEVSGLRETDPITIDPWTVVAELGLGAHSRFRPVPSGATIPVPGLTDKYFGPETSVQAQLYTTLLDGSPYCVNQDFPNDPPTPPLEQFIVANTIGEGEAANAPDILAGLTVRRGSAQFTIIGSYTFPRDGPIAGVDFPRSVMVLCARQT